MLMIDLIRLTNYDTRFGEDTYLVGEFASHYINTMQEKDEDGFVKVATTIKH